jgi:AcrR family transcriptional regulator
MRYSSHHKAETRQRIVDEASRRLRKDGIEGTGLVPLMKALGLTHGGFYAHFSSKDALVQAAMEAATAQVKDRWSTSHEAGKLRSLIDNYLSPPARDNPEYGCPLTTLGAELGLRGTPSPTSDDLAGFMAQALAPAEVHAEGDAAGLIALTTMIGAVVLSRALADRDASDRLLDTVRGAIRTPN